jgi:hypothetical protein
MRNFALIPLVLAAACEETEVPSEYATANLEQALVTPEEPLEGSRRDGSGQLTGSLDGPDMEVRVGTSAGLQVVDVHAPGRPDLTAFTGTQVLMSVLEVATPEEHALLIKDEDGEVIYLLETIEPSALTTEAFGGAFVDLGNDLGHTGAFRSDMQLFSVMVSTDAGTVEAFPGAPVEILVGGISYRFILTAAWERTLEPDAVLNCSIRTPVIAYDVSRVEPGTANLTVLDRDESLPIEQGTCGLAPPAR